MKPRPSGALGRVYFLVQESELNMEQQRSGLLLHISGTRSLKAAGLLRPPRPPDPLKTG